MSEEKRITVEDVLGDFGFRLRWSVSDYWADVEAFEIQGLDDDGPAFLTAGWQNSGDLATDTDAAEKYLHGFVKWDGCTELDMGRPHWCGPEGYAKHCALLKYIYHRAFELMGREAETPWPPDRTCGDD